MKKKLGFVAAAVAAAVLTGALSSAYAASKVKVTYRVPFFADVVEEIDAVPFPSKSLSQTCAGNPFTACRRGIS